MANAMQLSIRRTEEASPGRQSQQHSVFHYYSTAVLMPLLYTALCKSNMLCMAALLAGTCECTVHPWL